MASQDDSRRACHLGSPQDGAEIAGVSDAVGGNEQRSSPAMGPSQFFQRHRSDFLSLGDDALRGLGERLVTQLATTDLAHRHPTIGCQIGDLCQHGGFVSVLGQQDLVNLAVARTQQLSHGLTAFDVVAAETSWGGLVPTWRPVAALRVGGSAAHPSHRVGLGLLRCAAGHSDRLDLAVERCALPLGAAAPDGVAVACSSDRHSSVPDSSVPAPGRANTRATACATIPSPGPSPSVRLPQTVTDPPAALLSRSCI